MLPYLKNMISRSW